MKIKKIKRAESSPNFSDPGEREGSIYCQSFQHSVKSVPSYTEETALNNNNNHNHNHHHHHHNQCGEQKDLF